MKGLIWFPTIKSLTVDLHHLPQKGPKVEFEKVKRVEKVFNLKTCARGNDDSKIQKEEKNNYEWRLYYLKTN